MAGRPRRRRRPGAADGPGLRAERARRGRDGGPGRRAGRVAERAGADHGRRRPGAPPAHDRAGRPARRRRARSRPARRLHQDALLHDLFDLGYSPVTEVAGRGEFARRGGIVDVFPPSMPLPIRIEFFGDEIDSLRAFDPTDQRTVGTVDRSRAAAGVRVPAARRRRRGDPRAARAGRGRLPERLAADLARFEGEAGDDWPSAARSRTAAGARETRAVAVGDAAEVWAAQLAPATGLDHIGPGTLLAARRARRHRRGRRVPVAPGRRAASRTDRGRRPAQGLAVDVPAAARLEGPARRRRGPWS